MKFVEYQENFIKTVDEFNLKSKGEKKNVCQLLASKRSFTFRFTVGRLTNATLAYLVSRRFAIVHW